MPLRIIILFVLIGLMSGCDYIDETLNNIDTSHIKTELSPNGSYIHWEGYLIPKVENANASISKVQFECVKNYTVNETTKSKRREFDIPLTAVISYNITSDGEYMSPYHCDVIFEAVSNRGVVLGSSTGTAKLISNSTSTTVSAKILGLSPDEMKKVTKIIARWDFGK